MVEYSPKVDFEINKLVSEELIKKYVDVSKLRISTTKCVTEIKGELVFTGSLAGETDPGVILNMMRKIDLGLKSITYLRDVRWKLENWEKKGSKWIKKETKIQEEKK